MKLKFGGDASSASQPNRELSRQLPAGFNDDDCDVLAHDVDDQM